MKNLEKRGEFISNRIKNSFENKISSLDLDKQTHFMVRLYRVTENKKYINLIMKNLLSREDHILDDIISLNKKDFIKKRSEELFDNFKNKKGIKEIRRRRIFGNRKEHLFYYHIIEDLYLWKVFGISESKLGKYFEGGLKFLKRNNLRKYILNEEVVKYHGTQLINYVYYLKFLGVVDMINEFKELFIKIFMNERIKLSKYMYKNKIYGLTHFIIAASNYYQNYTSLKEFKWIIDYFRKDVDKILGNTNADIISEVGLCFKLCEINSSNEINLIRNYLLDSYNEKLGYIPRGKDKRLNSCEHRNIVAYLFLCNFKSLYKGPNLREEINRLL